jgi:hypothetical protein
VYDDGTAHSGKPTSIKFIGNTWSGQSGEGATNATSSGIDQGWFIAGAENVTFENNIFHDIARWGRALWFSQYATNGLITFRGNTFRNFKLPYPRAFFPTESPSILWIHSGTRVVIEDNIFQDNEIAPISVGITFNTATNQLESMIVNRNTFINNNTTWSAGTGASTNRHAVMFAVGVNHIVFDNNRVVTNYGGMFLGRAIRRFHAHGNTILGLGNGSFTADADAFEFRGDEPMIGVEVNNNQINGIDGRFLSGSNMGNLVVLGNSLGSIQRSHSTDYQISYSVNSSSLTNEPFINFGGFVNGNISYLASTSNPIRLDSSIDASAYTGPKLRVVDSYNYHPVTVLTNSVTANATALFLSN